MPGQNFLSDGNFDSLEQLILEQNIQIKAVDFHPEQNLMLVILNTGVVLHCALSSFQSLKNAPTNYLRHFKLIGHGLGIHWPDLDEDLSLKGLLRQVVLQTVKGPVAA